MYFKPRIFISSTMGDKLQLRTDIKNIFESAMEQIKNEHLNEKNTIIVGGENWHHGVIGIVSSKITEMYFKPSILLSFEEDGIGKGSRKKYPWI